MKNASFFHLYRKQLLAYSLVVIAAWLAACSKGNGYGGDNPPPGNTNYSISASLSGTQEVPANATTGSGTLTGTYDPSSYTITYTLSWTGLSGVPTGMHFHGPATTGQNAAVALAITSFTAAAAGSAYGTAVITAAQGADLIAGKWYTNIHTAAYGNGEIRGQVTATKN